MSQGSTSKSSTNASTAFRCATGRAERRMPTSSSATVMTESTHSETGGRRVFATRPRSRSTQTEVSSMNFTTRALFQLQVSDLRAQRLLAIREIPGFGKVLLHEARDICKGLQPRLRLRSQYHLMTTLFDLQLRTLEAKGSGKPYGLTATMLEELRSWHRYSM